MHGDGQVHAHGGRDPFACLTVTDNANNNPLTVGLTGSGIGSTTNLALNRPVTASSSYQTFVASNATDGNTSTYWESTDGTDLADHHGRPRGHVPDGSVTLDLPPSTAWSTRRDAVGARQHQRLHVQPDA